MSAPDRDDLSMEYEHDRVVGFARWKPHWYVKKTLLNVLDVIRRYEDYLPLGTRQIMYLLIGSALYLRTFQDGTQQRYTKADEGHITEVIARGRRAGRIPWEYISDGRSHQAGPLSYDTRQEWLDAIRGAARKAQLDRQHGQKQVVEVWCETASMLPQLRRVTDDYGVRLYSGSGDNPIDGIYRLSRRAVSRLLGPDGKFDLENFRLTDVLHIGDLDRAGVETTNRVRKDGTAMVRDTLFELGVSRKLAEEKARVILTVERLALLPSQVVEHDIPTEGYVPTKNWRPEWGEAAQAEAMPPDILADLVRGRLDELLDEDSRGAAKRREEAVRRGIVAALDTCERRFDGWACRLPAWAPVGDEDEEGDE